MVTSQWNLATLAAWRGREVVTEDGSKLGHLDSVVYDYKTFEPVWILTSAGPFHPRELLSPVNAVAADPGANQLRVAFTKQHLEDEPPIEVGEGWSSGEAARLLYNYFGLELSADDDVRVLHRHTELPGQERVYGGGARSP